MNTIGREPSEMPYRKDRAAIQSANQAAPGFAVSDPFDAHDGPSPHPTPAPSAYDPPYDTGNIAFSEPETGDQSAATAGGASSSPARSPRYGLIAASVVLAALIGAIAGAGTTVGWQGITPVAGGEEALAATRKLETEIARLQGQVAALKKGLDSTQQSTGTQIGKLTASLDRLERRTAQAASPEVTGSVSAAAKVARQEAKPPQSDGFQVRDFYSGRAIVETPAGKLYDVGAGSNLPGLGRVQSITREGSRIVLVTRGGTVANALDPRRPRYFHAHR
jgi:hypothetical protein